MRRSPKQYIVKYNKGYIREKTENGAVKILKQRRLPLRLGQKIYRYDVFIETEDAKIFSLEVLKQKKEIDLIEKISFIKNKEVIMSFDYGDAITLHSTNFTREEIAHVVETVYEGKDFDIALKINDKIGQIQEGMIYLSSMPLLKNISISKNSDRFINLFTGIEILHLVNSKITKCLPKFHCFKFLQELALVRIRFMNKTCERRFVKTLKNLRNLSKFRFEKVSLKNSISFEAEVTKAHETTNFLQMNGLDLNKSTQLNIKTDQVLNKHESVYWLVQFKKANLTLSRSNHKTFPFLKFKINDRST